MANKKRLRGYVEAVWSSVLFNMYRCPVEFRAVFHHVCGNFFFFLYWHVEFSRVGYPRVFCTEIPAWLRWITGGYAQ